MNDYDAPEEGRRRILFGGEEYDDPSLDAGSRPIRYHAKFRPSDFSVKRRRRGGFFSRRGSLILFIDVVIVAVVALTIYPVYGRRDKARWEGYTFTLSSERINDGVLFDLLVKAPGTEEKTVPGKVVSVVFSAGGASSGAMPLELPAREGTEAHHRAFLRTDHPPGDLLSSAEVTIDGSVYELKLEIR